VSNPSPNPPASQGRRRADRQNYRQDVALVATPTAERIRHVAETVDDEDAALIEATRAYARDAVHVTRTPGLSLAVARKGSVIWAEAFGMSDLARRRPMTIDATCRVGSFSKTYVAIAVMQLIERGVLELDTPVRRYLPDVDVSNPLGEREVTVYDLLTYRSGLAMDTETTASSRSGSPTTWPTPTAPTSARVRSRPAALDREGRRALPVFDAWNGDRRASCREDQPGRAIVCRLRSTGDCGAALAASDRVSPKRGGISTAGPTAWASVHRIRAIRGGADPHADGAQRFVARHITHHHPGDHVRLLLAFMSPRAARLMPASRAGECAAHADPAGRNCAIGRRIWLVERSWVRDEQPGSS